MAQPQRLPAVNGDDGAWGDILNQYLSKEHYNTGLDNPVNGGHQTVTIRPGTAAAGTAPLKFTAGPLLTTAEAGAVEFNSDKLYITNSTLTRKTIAAYDDAAAGGGANGDMHYRDAVGNFVRFPIGLNTYVLTAVGGVPTWAAPAGGGINNLDGGVASTVYGGTVTIDGGGA